MKTPPDLGALPVLTLSHAETYAAPAITFYAPEGVLYTSVMQLFNDIALWLQQHKDAPMLIRYASRIDRPTWPVIQDKGDRLTWLDPLQTIRDPVREINCVRRITLISTMSHPYHYHAATRESVTPTPENGVCELAGEPRASFTAGSYTFTSPGREQFNSASRLAHSQRNALQAHFDKFIMLMYVSRIRHDYWRAMLDPTAKTVWLDPLQSVRDPVREINRTGVLTMVSVPSSLYNFRRRSSGKTYDESISASSADGVHADEKLA